jgi:hypothetical protein
LNPHPGLAQQCRTLLRRLAGTHHDHVPPREHREIGVVGAVRDEPLGNERRQRLGERYTDKQYAAYGLDTQAAAALRQQFSGWQQQLTQPESDQDRS